MRQALVITLLFAATAQAAFAGSDCGRLAELKREWLALEEKTSGGLFFSGPSEVNRLFALRRIMEQPGAINMGCRDERRKADVDVRHEQMHPVP